MSVVAIEAGVTEYDIFKNVVDPAWTTNLNAKCGVQVVNNTFMEKTFLESGLI